MIYSKPKQVSDFKIVLLFSLFSFHQLFYIPKIGTWWDEPYNVLAGKLTVGKLKYLLFGIETKEYISDFSDHEFFGMFYQLQTFLFTKLSRFYQEFDLDYLNIRNELHFSYFLRHIYLHIYICVLLYIIYYLLKELQSEKFAFIYVVFLILIPTINGYSLFDDKDLPYGLHLFISFLLYFYFVKNFDKSNLKHLLPLTGLAFGTLLLIRFNGTVFLIISIISINIFFLKNLLNKKFIFNNLIIAGYALTVFLLGTIQGMSDYYKYLKNLYWQQFKVSTWFGETIVNGETFERSGDFTYIFKIFLYKLPIVYLLSILCLIFFYKKIIDNLLLLSTFTFLTIFFSAFIIFKPAAYNYERQYIFLFFFINLLVVFCIDFISSKTIQIIILSFFVFFTIYSQYGLEQYKYTYLNELVDEDSISTIEKGCFENGDCGTWSTDHLSISGLGLAEMAIKSQLPVFSCSPYQTVSLFNVKNSYINLNNNFIFESGKDVMDYTTLQTSVNDVKPTSTIFTNREQFSDYLSENNIKAFSIISEHHIQSTGNVCINKLKSQNSFKCVLVDENFVKLRNTKITINYLLKCDLDF
jgi:hypothetical protein